MQPPAAGFTFVAPSPIFAAVNIGCWTGSQDGLLHELRSVYGPEADVVTRSVLDARAGMESMHRKFADRELSGMFDQWCWNAYVTALQQL